MLWTLKCMAKAPPPLPPTPTMTLAPMNGHFGLNGLARRTSYIQTAKLLDFNNLRKIMENQLSYMNMLNNSST